MTWSSSGLLRGTKYQRVFCLVALPAILAFAAAPAQAEDWPQWRGEDRRGVWNETGIVEQFPEEGLRFKWRTPIHSGYTGPAVAAGRVFLMDYHEPEGSRPLEGLERALCLDEKTGQVVWSKEWPVDYKELMASYAIGPRATPSVDSERVYVVGAVGNLLCLNVETGEVIWQKDYQKDYDTQLSTWGVTSAPLVDDERLICVVGGQPDARIVAFDKMTGKEIWRSISGDWEMGYEQPIIIQAGGTRQLIIWQPKALNSLDPLTGKVYWEISYDVGASMTVATPVHSGNNLLVTQFYRGSMLVGLDTSNPQAKMLWRGQSRSERPELTDGLHSLITTPIIEGDYIYGVGSYGELRCLNVKDGERVWENKDMTRQGRWGTAFMVKNGDRWFVNNDEGDLIIARFSPDGYTEIDRTKLIKPTSSAGFGPRRFFDSTVNWSHPAYANRHIFARNDEEIVCASLEK